MADWCFVIEEPHVVMHSRECASSLIRESNTRVVM